MARLFQDRVLLAGRLDVNDEHGHSQTDAVAERIVAICF